MPLFARHDSPLTGTLFFLLWGPILWAGHLTIIYTGQALLCTLASDASGFEAADAIRLLIGGVTVVAGLTSSLGAALPVPPFRMLLRRKPADQDDFILIRVMRLLCFLAALGIFWAGFTYAVLPACSQGR